jgi:uncharacterized protein
MVRVLGAKFRAVFSVLVLAAASYAGDAMYGVSPVQAQDGREVGIMSGVNKPLTPLTLQGQASGQDYAAPLERRRKPKPQPRSNNNTPQVRNVAPKREEPVEPDLRQIQTARINAGTVTIVSGGVNGTYIRMAAELGSILDNDETLRLLPVVGKGSAQNIRDLLFLRGVDIGIVQSDAREGIRDEKDLYDDTKSQLQYIARLHNEEIHIVAASGITDIRQLNGRKVNIDVVGSGTNLTARALLGALGIKPEFTNFDQAASYQKLLAGEIDAAVYVAGRPVRGIAEFRGEGRFRLLPIPFEDALAELYLPARLASEDYPELIAKGESVSTLAVGSILAVYSWPEGSARYRRVERFVEAFFSKFEEFLKPGRHPKWQEVNLSAEVAGWKRFKAAEDWLKKNRDPGEARSVPSNKPRG